MLNYLFVHNHSLCGRRTANYIKRPDYLLSEVIVGLRSKTIEDSHKKLKEQQKPLELWLLASGGSRQVVHRIHPQSASLNKENTHKEFSYSRLEYRLYNSPIATPGRNMGALYKPPLS